MDKRHIGSLKTDRERHKICNATYKVFVDIFREENEIVVQMKNVSKDELTFNPQEITERFVRGDESRNSEGSGLGLAIVGSFTELQGGHFHVETEADLFKQRYGGRGK